MTLVYFTQRLSVNSIYSTIFVMEVQTSKMQKITTVISK